jgi:hypothetical protein
MSKNPDAFDDLKPNRGNDDKPLRALGRAGTFHHVVLRKSKH